MERISGFSYHAFLDKQIFQPLGMTRTCVYNTRRKQDTIPNYAWGYVCHQAGYILPDSLVEYDYVRYLDAITGDGTVNSCLQDLAKWEKALRENRLVSAETLKKAHSARILPKGKVTHYGYGWEIQDSTSTMGKGNLYRLLSTAKKVIPNRSDTIMATFSIRVKVGIFEKRH